MPLQATSGAASYDAFGGGVPAVPNYIEDVFSTYLTTGAGANITVVNGIDLSGKGGLVWQKTRTSAGGNTLFDTVRGVNKYLISNATNAQATASNILPTFNSDGFVIGTDNNLTTSGEAGVSWTFREAPKFFDVVTWTGNGTIGRTISHSLGSEPGCIIVKKTNSAGASDWVVYHRSLGATKAMILNLTDSVYTWSVWNDTAPTSTVFSLNDASEVNGVGNTYVAYLFAHNAGGFGLTGTDNVISCGSYTGTGSTLSVTLGYEPQWILVKRATGGTNDWILMDTMRGMALTDASWLNPNTSAAESTALGQQCNPTATGFTITSSGTNLNAGGATYIYIAIRRGPMKVPTSGTSVFSPNTATYSANQVVTTGFPVDMLMMKGRTITFGTLVYDRLRGLASTNTSPVDPQLLTSDTSAETSGDYVNTANNTGYQISPGFSGFSSVNWNFRRAPSFFDEVCYTGDGAATRTLAHNLTVAPEWIILRRRNSSGYWYNYFNFGSTSCSILQLEDTVGASSSDYTGLFSKMGGAPTSSSFFVTNPAFGETNSSGTTYVAYLFATLAGVSKVGTYTGTGALQTINCGFTGGARFVIIKRTSAVGAWYVWDTARGMVSGTDPDLRLNSTNAEVNQNSVYTIATGFQLLASPAADVNISGSTYLFLAIA